MKRIMIMLAMLLAFAGSIQAERLVVSDLVLSGGENPVLRIGLHNDNLNLTAWQMILTLPEGVRLVSDGTGSYTSSLSSRHASSHQIEIKEHEANRYILVCTSVVNDVISGTEGELIAIPLAIDVPLDNGVLEGHIDEALIVDSMTNGATNLESVSFQIMNAIYASAKTNLIIESGHTAEFTINLNNGNVNVAAWQCQLNLPEGISIDTIASGQYAAYLSERHTTDRHLLTVYQKDDGVYSLVCYSTDNSTLSGSEGPIVTISLKADYSASGQEFIGLISDIVVADTASKTNLLEDIDFDIVVADEPIVTITIDSVSREYGEQNPEFTYSVSGTSLRGEPLIVTEATNKSDVGTYIITAQQGTVENKYMDVVDATITIVKAPLSIFLEGVYTRYEDEPNPDFTLGYQGLKLDDDDTNIFTIKPSITTEATEQSSPGVYPVEVNGGEAKNYTLSYSGSTLTILPRYFDISLSVGKGGKAGFGGQYADSISISARKDSVLHLSVLPNEGYHISRVTLGQQDITALLSEENGYFVKDISATESTHIDVNFAPNRYTLIYIVDGEVVQRDSVTYNAPITPLAEPNKEGYTFSGWSEIPATMPAHDVTVIGTFVDSPFKINNLVFNYDKEKGGYELAGTEEPEAKEVTIPQEIKGKPVVNVPEGTFAGNTQMQVLIWDSEAPVDAACFGIPEEHGNLLVFVSGDVEVTYQGNVIRNGVAKSITLYDGRPFSNPQAFIAEYISITKDFSKETIIGSTSGWETFVVPFEVDSITTEDGQLIAPFGADANTDKHFWLAKMDANVGFTKDSLIRANVPYIISMPNSERYIEEYRINGKVTFHGRNVVVQPTANATSNAGPLFGLVPTYQEVAAADSVFVLNDEPYEADGITWPAGSVFVRSSRAARPFEAYTYANASNGGNVKGYIRIDELANGIQRPTPDPSRNGGEAGAMYDLSGRKISVSSVHSASSVLPKGVYIMDGQKVLVK